MTMKEQGCIVSQSRQICTGAKQNPPANKIYTHEKKKNFNGQSSNLFSFISLSTTLVVFCYLTLEINSNIHVFLNRKD